MTPTFTPDIISEDTGQLRQFHEEGVAPSSTSPAQPRPVYWFGKGEIWSNLGGEHPLTIGGALATLESIQRHSDPSSRLYWPNACEALRAQLADAIAAYRKHWTAKLEAAQ